MASTFANLAKQRLWLSCLVQRKHVRQFRRGASFLCQLQIIKSVPDELNRNLQFGSHAYQAQSCKLSQVSVAFGAFHWSSAALQGHQARRKLIWLVFPVSSGCGSSFISYWYKEAQLFN